MQKKCQRFGIFMLIVKSWARLFLRYVTQRMSPEKDIKKHIALPPARGLSDQFGSRMSEAEKLAELIKESRSTVALTGAGISVPSGIPDFRTPGTGIWENVDPMEVANIEVFRRDPKRFWSFYRPRFNMLEDKQPNPAHTVLAELEERGLLEGVITQNIDRLHRKAGSKKIVEVHGTVETSSCLDCGESYKLEEVETLFDGDEIAKCRSCDGSVKPDVVLFGEMLPEEAIFEAQQMARGADLMLCIGSSLVVQPVASLPTLTAHSGGKIAILTKSETPYDAEAEVRMNGDVVEEMQAVLQLIG